MSDLQKWKDFLTECKIPFVADEYMHNSEKEGVNGSEFEETHVAELMVGAEIDDDGGMPMMIPELFGNMGFARLIICFNKSDESFRHFYTFG